MGYDKKYNEERKDIIKITKKQYRSIINEITKLRTVAEHTTAILFADQEYYTNKSKKLDFNLMDIIQSLFIRMVKTSKVITDLSIQGDYVEAISLLRNNFEKSILIMYLIVEPDLVVKWIDMNNECDDKKRINIEKTFFSKRKIITRLKKDYKQYQSLCIAVHPNILQEDSYLFENIFPKSIGIVISRTPEFSLNHLTYISELNYNTLIETFLEIKKFMLSYADKRKLKGRFKRIINKSNKFETVKFVIDES